MQELKLPRVSDKNFESAASFGSSAAMGYMHNITGLNTPLLPSSASGPVDEKGSTPAGCTQLVTARI
jgi:hypothetical protein